MFWEGAQGTYVEDGREGAGILPEAFEHGLLTLDNVNGFSVSHELMGPIVYLGGEISGDTIKLLSF